MANLTDEFASLFVCPETKEPLTYDKEGEFFVSPSGRKYPVVRGIPRFVASDAYVDSFSFEWNTHNQTQLDSARGDSLSDGHFREKTGFTPEEINGKLVLDAGTGAGRFAEVVARWGGKVVGVDLSYAVEASSNNLSDYPNAMVAQADIGKLPFRPGTFDFIFSIGVLHHTPSTRKHFEALLPLLKPGGSIAIWVYPNTGDYLNRSKWIPFTCRIPDRMFYEWCRWFVPLVKKYHENSFVRWIGRAFPYSDQPYGLENDILDTFDGFSPRYHFVHSQEEVEGWFQAAGLKQILQPSSWIACARGTKP